MDKITELAVRNIEINLTRAATYEDAARTIAIPEVKRLAREILQCGKFDQFAIGMGMWHFTRDLSLWNENLPNNTIDQENAATVQETEDVLLLTDDEIQKITTLGEFIFKYDDVLKLTGEGLFINRDGTESDGMG